MRTRGKKRGTCLPIPSHAHAHTHITSLVYTDVYTEQEYTPSLDTQTHSERHKWWEQCCCETWDIYLKSWIHHTHIHALNISSHLAFTHTHTHAHKPSPSFPGPHWLSSKCLGASGIQLAFGACIKIQIVLTLKVTVTVPAPPSAREDQTKKRLKKNKKDRIPTPFPSLSHCSDCCCCCFKGVFVQKCSFYDCYYNYCYDYLIKDLYHTEETRWLRFSCGTFLVWLT